MAKLVLKPLGKNIIVELAEVAEKTKGGIIIAEIAKEKPSEGRVLAVGEQVKEIAVKDWVIFSKYAGNSVIIDDKESVVLKEDDIHAVLLGK